MSGVHRLPIAGHRRRTETEEAILKGRRHRLQELFADGIGWISLGQTVRADDLVQGLQALTTDRFREAACREAGGKRHGA